ncbi:HIT family protein [Lactobacillus sp. ESL0791]|uniref:HIT family protein n=1 Tax=Lactobacillus sp. ESL0791 TaxID=2983234 RepID=UPI0023F6ABCB|nr:HIT family protein [Lactobacillus sp. ESL0791]MDF7638674.1 HIT family protein [Lactobacillus sp. ESL0791]
MMEKNCEICRRIALIKENKNPYFVKELATGYVVLGDNQYFKGYTLFLCKQHKTELHFLERAYEDQFLHEMSLVSEAVYHAFAADKMNCELLGNGDSHVHWHLFPRKKNDTPVPGPVWWLDRNIMYDDANKLSAGELQLFKDRLKRELDKVL